MTIEQQTFLGASIRNFSATAGWGTQPSILTVDLVEDDTNGDNFSPPSVGSAVYFKYVDWEFNGLLQSYNVHYGQDGNPIYSVQVQDPRELLAGVQLILQDYSGGTYGMPNIYNIFGYLENLYGFGGAQTNESGMPWWLLRNAFYYLQLTTPICFRGSYYIFDPFYGLPLLPDYYRVAGDHISALDFIQDTCEAISADFMVELVKVDDPKFPSTNWIKVRLIDRNYTLRPNAINDFVKYTPGAVAKSSGYELSNEVMNRFVVGGKLNNIYFQSQAYTSNNTTRDGDDRGEYYYYDDMIAPYWGYNAYGNLVVGHGDFNGETGKEYQFTIDGRPLYLQTNNQSLIDYTTDLAEMQAARGGQSTWESFLWIHNDNIKSIHHKKAEKIGLCDGKLDADLMKVLKDAKKDEDKVLPETVGPRVADTKKDFVKKSHIENEKIKKKITTVYNYIKQYATEYYGKKFMVRIPFVAGKYVPESNIYEFSLKPTSTGYVEEIYWNIASARGLMPFNPEKFTDSNNKIYAYARFSGMTELSDKDTPSKYAFDQLSPQSYILDQYPNQRLGKMRENLFVKCTVDENIVYLNPRTLFSPRVVITLDGPVADAVTNPEIHYTALLNELKTWLLDEPTTLTESEVEEWGSKFISFVGNDISWKPKGAAFNIPDMVAVPLESQILRYGPWYISNGSGKVEFENDSSLVPWNYGGFTAMNNAGWAKVSNALISQQVHEMGDIEFPGVPEISIGHALLDSGPIVTDVNVSVGQNGVTTRYKMQTWTHQFGRLGKYNVNRYTKMAKLAQQQRKAFRKLYGYAEPQKYISGSAKSDPTTDAPSAGMVMAELAIEKDKDGKIISAKPSVATMPITKVAKTLSDDTYIGKAAISLDGLFVPYTTKVDSSGILPHFELPTSEAPTPTVEDLNPFGSDSIARVLPETEDDKLPIDIKEGDDNKGIALRAPLIVAGWGRDTNNDPIPSGGDGEYYTDYKKRADQWKVGPVDLRWNNSRKVWAADGGSSLKVGSLLENIPGGSGVGQMCVYEYNNDLKMYQPTSEKIEVHEVLLNPDNDMLLQATRVIVASINGNWVIVSAGDVCYI